MSLDTLWGDFEEIEETPEAPIEKETEVDDEEETDSKSPDSVGEEGDEVEKPKEEEGKEEEKEKGKDTETDEDDITKAFDDIAAALEEEELLFLEEDKQYDATPEGFKKMMADNMSAYKSKMENEFKNREAQIRREFEDKNKVKIADLDPSDESQAEEMLEKYYLETGFTEDEVKDKIKEVKELENLEKEAKIAKRYLGKLEEKEEAKRAKEEADRELERQTQINEYIEAVKSEIDEMEEMSGFKLSPKMKKDFKNYLFETDKEGLTPAQKASKDPKRRLKLAFLDFVDYNKKDFEIKAKTELANEYSKKVSRFTSKQSKAKGKSVEVNSDEEQEGFQPGFLDFWSPESK